MSDALELSEDLKSLLSALAESPSWPLDAPAPRIAPGDRIGRYRLEGVIGHGGFGVVFSAHDEELDRRVAVKVTRGEPTPEVLARFRREAQLAARLNHPNLVTLHDFGTISGLPYLILELLDGETLQERLTRGPLDPGGALAMIADVLSALVHAHAAGIAHLDLKPSNVFLTSDGRVKVLDFGLAQLRGGPVELRRAGTPAYMAPEQWRATPAGPSADVFSAGVMLFAMVAGALPFRSDDHGAEVMSDAPAPPLPLGDQRLSTIVARALEKNPARRFSGAGEMLAAVTALTRPRIRRARLLLGVGLTVGLLLTLGLLTLRARRAAVDDARAAAYASGEAQAIEAQLRYARLQPLHDLGPEEAAARSRLSALTVEVNRLGDVGEGAAELALGRGLLALGDLTAARDHLETAWRRGYRTSEVNAALGHTLLALYADRMSVALHTMDSERRAQLIEKLGHELRDPALEYLRASNERSPFVQAQIALYEAHYEDARRHAHDALAREPGLYEADALIGDAHVSEALLAEERGDWQSELDQLARAGEGYQAAIAIARSDPALYVADSHRWSMEQLALVSRGDDAVAAFNRSKEECARALVARPADAHATAQCAASYNQRAQEMSQKGQDGRSLIDDGMILVERARRAHLNDAPLALAAGTLAMTRAYIDDTHGVDPRPSFDASDRAFREATRLDPDGEAGERAARTAIGRAEYESTHGIDPTATVEHALGQLRHQTVTNLTTTGRLLTARSSWEIAHGRDPLQSLVQALPAFAQARVRRPNDLIAADEEGATWAARAEWQRENGQDPRPSIDRSIACSEDVLRIDPKDLDGHGNLGIELIERAEAERRYAGDPTPLLARARKSLDHALAIDPENVSVLQNLGLVGERQARELADHGHDPTADLQAARRSLAHAQTIKRDDLTVLPVMCDLDRAAARWDLHLGRSPAAAFARARVSCEGALALDHDSSPLGLQSAELAADVAGWKRHAGLDPSADQARGLRLVRAVLARRPAWNEARALEASLLPAH